VLRDRSLFLDDIASSCRKISSFVEGYTYDEFLLDEKTFDAVVRNLEVIGEAVKHLSADFREQHPSTDWRAIAGMRDILSHVYFALDLEVLWNVVQVEVPQLLVSVQEILGSNQDENPDS
jgi:uncharacterized protein with HEPN domain